MTETRRCFRCQGAKKLFKLNNCYSRTNTGGKEVDCPMCKGEGRILTREAFEKQMNEKEAEQESIEKFKKKGRPKKQVKDDKEG